MDPAPFPWWISGGWAIDLFIGRQTREHEDVDVGIFRADQEALRDLLGDWEILVAARGRLREWRTAEVLVAPDNDLWVREDSGGPWRLQVMLNDGGDGTWVFRRDRTVTFPLREALERSPDGTPYLAPHLQLLFKSRDPRPRDHADFSAVLPHLSVERRRWLAQQLKVVTPVHPWTEALS